MAESWSAENMMNCWRIASCTPSYTTCSSILKRAPRLCNCSRLEFVQLCNSFFHGSGEGLDFIGRIASGPKSITDLFMRELREHAANPFHIGAGNIFPDPAMPQL